MRFLLGLAVGVLIGLASGVFLYPTIRAPRHTTHEAALILYLASQNPPARVSFPDWMISAMTDQLWAATVQEDCDGMKRRNGMRTWQEQDADRIAGRER